ncbi:MAG: 23S rRNA (pseudouridine(1915)-N(3))-methyltransferase RlmH [Solobacterium sp.]|nr:23S rRNA (pseudouridine(1915)-N(3))-methyltransferase RlmH [Solobacterium sp.]
MIRLICVGKLKEKWMRMGMDEYLKRLKAYDKIEMIEVEDEHAPESNSDAQNEQVKSEEGKRILRQIREDEYVILLDLKGKCWTSIEMAAHLQNLYDYGKNKIAFVIGGSLGLSQDVIKRADYRWKISDETFPHQLCRLLVIEQIYRSFRINRNEPYHK